MKKALHGLIALLCCLQLAGGPLGLLQGYAWCTMLVDYSRESGWSQAVRDTFSGEKPCQLCRKIESTRQSAPTEPAPAAPPHAEQLAKLLRDLLPVASARLGDPIASAIASTNFPSPDHFRPLDGTAPPVPPPRRA